MRVSQKDYLCGWKENVFSVNTPPYLKLLLGRKTVVRPSHFLSVFNKFDGLVT